MFESQKKGVEDMGVIKPARRVIDAVENAFFDHVDNPDAEPPWEVLCDSQKGKFRRVQALFSVLRDVIPDPVFKKLTGKRYEYQGEVLPINVERYEFDARKIGSGEECNVYKLVSLDMERPTLVIKIDTTTTQNIDGLVTRGKLIRSEYEVTKDWYRAIPDCIPEEFQFIGHSPRGGRKALFTIQKYYGMADQIHDLFRSYSKEELIEILRSEPELRATFITFSKVTLDRVESHDEVIDTLGNNNVVLVDNPDGRHNLRLLDPHVVKHPNHPVNVDEGKRIRLDLRFLQEVSAALQAETETKK